MGRLRLAFRCGVSVRALVASQNTQLESWVSRSARSEARLIAHLPRLSLLLSCDCGSSGGASERHRPRRHDGGGRGPGWRQIADAHDDPARQRAEQSAPHLVKDYVAFYRPRGQGSTALSARSTTMQTRSTSLAGRHDQLSEPSPWPRPSRTRGGEGTTQSRWRT